MRQISEFPRVELGVLPTPLYKLENLSRETGKNIYIKRDDMIGVALGRQQGQKVGIFAGRCQRKGSGRRLYRRRCAVQPRHADRACASRLGMRAVLSSKSAASLPEATKS